MTLLLPAPCSLLPAPCSLLPVPYSLFPAPYSLLPAPYSLLPISTVNFSFVRLLKDYDRYTTSQLLYCPVSSRKRL
ncbi:MAG: hypothetical protein F6K63_30705 [Moorea sp. SIO1G6]|nr:hypothetical protein [Moorena sp. SIO1G6]